MEKEKGYGWFSFAHKGGTVVVEFPAESSADAQDQVRSMRYGALKYDGFATLCVEDKPVKDGAPTDIYEFQGFGPGEAGGCTTEKAAAPSYTAVELQDAIDRDRIDGFMVFAQNLDEKSVSLVYGTNRQAVSIARALKKAGY